MPNIVINRRVVFGRRKNPMEKPSSLFAVYVGVSDVKLTWKDNATIETGYTVERSLNGITWSVLTTLPANTTTYTDTTSLPATAYYYRVKATNAVVGDSNYSNIAVIGLSSGIGSMIIGSTFIVN